MLRWFGSWPPGPRASFLGIGIILADGTINATTRMGNGQNLIQGVTHTPGTGVYLINLIDRPPNSIPIGIVQALNTNFFSTVPPGTIGPPAQLAVTLSGLEAPGDFDFAIAIFSM